MEQKNELLESALEYARNGMPVFPVHTPTDEGGCSCNNSKCSSVGKHPRIKNGHKSATTNERLIKFFWKKWPDANIGLVTGSKSEFFVLDVDDGGEEELSKHPSLPESVESITGGGWRHVLFAIPKGKTIKNKVRFCKGLDIRGEGGYIVAPPCLHKSGKRYEWKNEGIPAKGKLAECPDWIIDAINTNEKKERIASIDYGDRIPDGTRNDTLFHYACKLTHKGLAEKEIITLVTSRNKDQCDTPLDDAEIMRLIKSALTYGTDDITRPKLDGVLSKMILTFNEFENVDLPERQMLLSPWIQESDIILISSDPGVGKTWFSMEICSAIQSGRAAMAGLWNVENSVKSLYCEGESHWDDIKRMGKLTGLGDARILSKSYLEHHDVTPQLNLDTDEVRGLIYDYIIKNEIKFVVLDNLFSLWAGIDLDNATEWHEPNQWLLKLRSKGVCIVLLHHTNKAGKQIGTSSKLFNINTALVLKKKRQSNSKGEAITSFSIGVDKQRAKGTGLDAYTFACNDGKWSYTDKNGGNADSVEDSKAQLIVPLLLDDKITKQKDIGEFLGCDPSYITQVKNKNKDLFESDGSPNSKGADVLKKNREMLQSFYKKKGLEEK